MEKVKNYDHTEHTHRFAIWTAARAAQRGFTTTKNIGQAIELTDLRRFSQSEKDMSAEEFDEWHKKQCHALMTYLNNQDKINTQGNVVGNLQCSYGRAAKIIAIYLKTRVVIPKPNDKLSSIIHPPIDAILIKNLYQNRKELKFNSVFKSLKWTQTDETEYFELIYHLRQIVKDAPFWKLEYYWRV
mgnify:FL=1|jgi:hypothetical protein